jgi:hypothetical protein
VKRPRVRVGADMSFSWSRRVRTALPSGRR